MIGTESLDFEIDTRGRLPKSIKRRINFMTNWQMQFIIGHEYAHHYLGHLENASISTYAKISYTSRDVNRYTYSQSCEFDADYHSISETNLEGWKKTELIDGAFLFFSFIDMYNKVEDYLFPKISSSNTHPAPEERIWRLRESIHSKNGLSQTSLKQILEYNNIFIKGFLEKFLPYNVEAIETIGSIYLPSYKKKILIDRLDM
jgi:hypothetical protein